MKHGSQSFADGGKDLVDVLIVGGGPSGLSAALFLGRCMRKVLVCDAGHPRNESSPAMHGFLGHDGIPLAEFLEKCRKQLETYPSVTLKNTKVECIIRGSAGFIVRDVEENEWNAKSVLIAAGLSDELPDVPGIRDFYGVSVHHCPYCDGWENRGKKIGVIGNDRVAAELAEELLQWSSDIILFTNNPTISSEIAWVEKKNVRIVEGKISGLAGEGKILSEVRIEDGSVIRRESLFFSPAQAQHSTLAREIGCQLDHNCVGCDPDGRTQIEGLFAAGNATKGIQMAIMAAAEGLRTAAAINTWLIAYEKSYLSPPELTGSGFT